jgi:hypothetical protein
MRLCVYVVKHDYGFVPNPFFGYCTVAACTPNHQNVRLSKGDWLMGHGTVAQGQRLVYAMKVDETKAFDLYDADPRFAQKKPRFDRTWREACGDNIYHTDEDGRWVQSQTWFHDTPEDRDKDTKHPVVFIAKHFYYFGEKAPQIPARFTDLLRDRQGCKVHQTAMAREFVDWLQATFTPGVLGDPRDLHEWLQGDEVCTPPDCSLERARALVVAEQPATADRPRDCVEPVRPVKPVGTFRTSVLANGQTLLEVWNADGRRTVNTTYGSGFALNAEVRCRKLLEQGFERIAGDAPATSGLRASAPQTPTVFSSAR